VSSNKLYNLLLKGWFRIKGRSSRQEYILRFLIMIFITIVASFLIKLNKNIEENYFNVLIMLAIGFIVLIVLFLSIIQVFFVTHRRLHDLNASGWWQLITFIPFGQLLMIAFIFFKGTEGRNKYGDPPKY
jgi:uncharacterized membrane protein YhaH (DUF805 family)